MSTNTLESTSTTNLVGKHVEKKEFKEVGKHPILYKIDAGMKKYWIGKPK